MNWPAFAFLAISGASMTIAGYDREAGTVSIIFQIVGAGTMELNTLNSSICV